MKQDQMSMAASIESRVPFLDHVLVEFTARIPARYSIHGLSGKQILKLAVAGPASPFHRASQKMGFPTPWAYWLAGPQLDDIEKMLLEPRTLERGLIERDAVQKLIRRTSHRPPRQRRSNLASAESRNLAPRFCGWGVAVVKIGFAATNCGNGGLANTRSVSPATYLPLVARSRYTLSHCSRTASQVYFCESS